MENASKALIIAGAILISILLISAGILIFNSGSGISDDSEATGDAMALAAAEENSRIVLSTMDIENDAIFNNYIKSKYEGRTLTKTEVIELCTLVIERTKQITGAEYSRDETYITTQSTYAVYHDHRGYTFNLEDDKLYKVSFVQSWNQEQNTAKEQIFSVQVTKVN